MTDQPTEPNEADDAELIRRYVERDDREALGLLFRRHGEFAYRVALRVMRNPSEAEDAVQAAFVRIMGKADRYRGGDGVRIWLMKTIVNTCKDRIESAVRRRKREQTYAENALQKDDSAGENMDRTLDKVKWALNQLPEAHRLSIWLHHYEGLSFREVAAVLSVSETVARIGASRGVRKLRQSLAQAGVAVSSVAIPDLVSKLPPDPLPETLLPGLERLSKETAVSPPGSRRAGARSSWARPFRMVATIGGATALAALAGGRLFRQTDPKRAEPVVVSDPGPAEQFHRAWIFDRPGQTNGLRVTHGSWFHVEAKGKDGSGFMEISEIPFVVNLHVPAEHLPVKMVYKARVVTDAGKKGADAVSASYVSWERPKHGGQFSGLGRMTSIPLSEKTGPWQTHVVYVSDTWLDQWMSGRRMKLFFQRGVEDGSDLSLVMHGGRYQLESITVHAIRPDEVPDLTPYRQALADIPLEKRTGVVPLPQLEPGDPKEQVSVRFVKFQQ